MRFDRTNTSLLGRWWWTVDRPAWFALILLMCLGAVIVTAASPPVAERLGRDPFFFVSRQHGYLLLSVVVLFSVSLLSTDQVRRLGNLVFFGSLVLMALLPFIGYENKGATRWLRFAGMSLQPSEFLKPAFAVVMAWIFAQGIRNRHFPSYRIALALFAVVAGLLIIQPDFGMTMALGGVFGLQFFLAGVSFIWVLALLMAGLGGMILAYWFLPHVTHRIDRFLDPDSGDNYQVEKSLEAFKNGGWLGRGPGEGEVKRLIPDSHTDFVFSVAGEEYGLIICLLIIGLFAFVVLRGFWRLQQEVDVFVMLAVAGLLAQFGIQAIINMGVAVNMLPAKGMTLPFLSYGGSSLLGMALAMGMLLALTRKRYGGYKVSL